MKKLSALAVIFLFQLFNSYAQFTFEKTIGGDSLQVGNDIIQTADGGYFISGSTKSFGAGESESYFVKTDSVGNISWTKTLGGPDVESSFDIIQASDEGFIIGGITKSFGAGSYDISLTKIDTAGVMEWSKTYGGTDDDRFGSIFQTSDGGYIVTGRSESFTLAEQVYLLKLDSAGNVLWEKTFGGSNDDEGFQVLQTNDNGFIILGSTFFSGPGNPDAYLIKTDENGNLLWSKTYGSNDWEEVYGIYVEPNGDYVFSGATTNQSASSSAAFVIRTNGNGDTLWSHIYNASGTDYIHSMAISTAGDIVLAGYIIDTTFTMSEDCLLMSIDLSGNPQWAKVYGGTRMEVFQKICSTSDGGYAMTGYSASFDTADGKIYFIKTDANGNSFCNDAIENISLGNIPITITVPLTIETTVTGIVGIPSFTISSGGADNTLCSSIGIDEVLPDLEINIYPNPAGDQITIFYDDVQPTKIEIFNLPGIKVMDVALKNSSSLQTISLDHFLPGVYFISLKTESGTIVRKLIKE